MRNRRLMALAALAVLTAAAAAARADLPPPPPNRAQKKQPAPTFQTLKSTSFPLEVLRTRSGEPARIEIPRAALGPEKPGAAGTLGVPGDATGALRTVVSGLSLSLALAFGGLWLARRRRRLALGTFAAGAGVAALAAVIPGPVDANMAPFPLPIASTNAQVKIVERGKAIRVFLTRETIDALTGEGNGKPAPTSAPPPTAAPQKN